MKRILILVAINLVLCSSARTFQDGGGKSTKPPTATPKAPSAPKPKVEPRPSVGTKPKARTNRLSITAYTDEILLSDKQYMSIDLSSNGKLFWVDYFSGTLGNLELNSLKETTLLTGLKSPTTVKVKHNRVYFTEVGTQANKYKDGSLSYFDVGTNRVHKLLDNLDYPNGLWVTASSDIYFTEAGGSSTSFGGVRQVCLLRRDTSNKVVISKADDPESVVVDESNQMIFVSSMGSGSPGETGTLAGFTMDGRSNTIFLTKLSSPGDMALDKDGNIYIAGYGKETGHFTGIAVSLIGNRSEWLPLKKGVFVNSLTVSENGDIYYSTGRSENKLRVLRLRRPPAPPAREEGQRHALPKAPMNAANTKANPAAGIGALPLRDFEFGVVTVNSSGSETSRRKGQAQYCTEEIAGISLELVPIRGGTFVMGSTEDDSEKPPHQVTVGPFYMGKYEVTQAQWRAVASLPKMARDLNSEPSKFKGDNLPVEQVSWDDAVEFCARLSRATGRGYRLPTEAEWEYTCRAGTTTPFAFGQSITPQIVNYNGDYPYEQAPKGTNRETTMPVGFMGVANGFGLFDMHGNVGEWCMDYWHENYSGAPADGSSWETAGDTGNRVLRGGSWLLTASDARSACRYNFTPDFRSLNYGFRVVAVVRTP